MERRTGLPGTTYYTMIRQFVQRQFHGRLIKSVDNAGNVTCLTYDSCIATQFHGRLGPYASVTPL